MQVFFLTRSFSQAKSGFSHRRRPVALLVGCLSWSSGFWFIPKTICITHYFFSFFSLYCFNFFFNGFKTRCSVKQHTSRVLNISHTLRMSWRNVKLYQYVKTSCPWWPVSCVHAVVCDVVMVTVRKCKPARSPSLLAPQLFLSLYSIVKKLYIYIICACVSLLLLFWGGGGSLLWLVEGRWVFLFILICHLSCSVM